MAVGMVGFIGVGVNSNTGATSVAVCDYLPFVSETLTLQRNDLPDPSIWHNFDERKMYNGLQRVEGAVTVVMHPLLTGYLLRTLFDQSTSQPGWIAASHSNVRAHRFTTGQGLFHAGSGSDLPTLTLEVNRGPQIAAGSSFAYYGCTGNTGEITIAAGDFGRMTVNMLAQAEGGLPRSTPSFVPAEAFLWNTASVSNNGVGQPNFENITIRIENNMQQFPTLNNALTIDQIKRNDFRRVSVNGQIAFTDFTEYQNFKNGSETQLRVTFTGKQISTSPANNEVLDIFLPRFRYSAFAPNISGPARLAIQFQGRAMIDPTSNYSMEVTQVNTRISPYTVNTVA